jgi:tRNA threonylcarbamoyladenosine biosynthesis protein TsaE
MDQESFTTISVDETRTFGRRLAGRLAPGAVIGLVGDLGSGKTCLVQAVCHALGVRELVTSPTFILVNEYIGRDEQDRPLPIYHFDLYRLLGEEELLDLGSDDYFYGDGVCLVEWADMAGDLLPRDSTLITIEHAGENSRRFNVRWGNVLREG